MASVSFLEAGAQIKINWIQADHRRVLEPSASSNRGLAALSFFPSLIPATSHWQWQWVVGHPSRNAPCPHAPFSRQLSCPHRQVWLQASVFPLICPCRRI
eukprot:1141656-Pelagomonas_calceolata.AAC.7